MKISLCTMMDDNFMVAFRAFFKSFIYHNKGFLYSGYHFVIIDVGLSDESKREIREYYNLVIFRKPKLLNYVDVNMDITVSKLKNTYYTLDLFSYTDYDRIVFLDMDMIIFDDISELFKCNAPIAGVKCYDSKRDRLTEAINAGVFVVNKPYLNESTYQNLIEIIKDGYQMPEQKTMNIYFKGILEFFNKSYNVEKRMLHTQKYKHILRNMKILHFVSKKPWELNVNFPEREYTYGVLENLWHYWNNKKWSECL